MTAAPGLAVPSARGALHYVIGAFTAPNARVRELMAEPGLRNLAWLIVLFGAVVSAGAGMAADHLLGIRVAESLVFPVEYAFGDVLFNAAMECLIFGAGFLLTVLLWCYLFGYRDRKDGVWAASAMTTCPAMLFGPAISIGQVVVGAGFFGLAVTALAYLVVSASIGAIYYRSALAISYPRAACLLLLSTLISFAVLLVLMFAALLLIFFWFGLITP